MNSASIVGVLSLQGDFAEHLAVLKAMDVKALEVRSVDNLSKVQKLIMPGGESTTMSKLLSSTGLMRSIRDRVNDGTLSVYGTCAGAILLAKDVRGKNTPPTLDLLDITMERNAYGTQLQSFQAKLSIAGMTKKVPVAFIRAPVITRIGKGIEVLASHGGHPVLVRQGIIWAGTFHPEIRGQAEVHKLFLSQT